jgi:hypothetical protein
MLRFTPLLAVACALAAASASADGVRRTPGFITSPTDEYAPAPMPPRAQRTPLRAPALRDGGLTAYIRTLPGSSYSDAPSASTYYYHPYPQSSPRYTPRTTVPPVPTGVFTREDYDGAPCPTRSRTSLGELFACTLR